MTATAARLFEGAEWDFAKRIAQSPRTHRGCAAAATTYRRVQFHRATLRFAIARPESSVERLAGNLRFPHDFIAAGPLRLVQELEQ